MSNNRFNRNILLFGKQGQKAIRDSSAIVYGAGGLGTHVIQQLALLGVERITVIDDEELTQSNKNRYIGAYHKDPVPGIAKVEIAKRLVLAIDPAIKFIGLRANVLSAIGFDAFPNSEVVLGCLDDDGPRFVLNALAAAYSKPYIDLASDVSNGRFGGRVITNWDGKGCLYCLDELDQFKIQSFLESTEERVLRESVYGIDNAALGTSGPSVVSVNGTIASIAVTEYMCAITGMRPAKKFLNYDGICGRVGTREQTPLPGCPYCSARGQQDMSVFTKLLARINSKDS